MAQLQDILEFYKDKRGEWRWRRIASNGNIIADSGEGYKDLLDCQHMGFRVNGGDYSTRTVDL